MVLLSRQSQHHTNSFGGGQFLALLLWYLSQTQWLLWLCPAWRRL